MRATHLVRIAFASVLKNTLRSFLTMLGIIIGVAAVITMVAIGRGAQEQIRRSIQQLGTNLIVITPSANRTGGVSRGAGSFASLTVDDAVKLQRESLLLSAVSPVVLAPSQIVGPSTNWRTLVYGVAPEYQQIRDWQIAAGTFFDQDALRSARKVAVIGATVAVQVFGEDDPVGQSLRIRGVPVDVIGVLEPKGQGADGSDLDDVVLVPHTTARQRLAGRTFIGQILASTFSPDDVAAAQEEVKAILRESHKLTEWDEDDFVVRNQTEIANAAAGTTEVMTLLLAAIAGISLLVGGIGIMNIMLVSVTERTREIGLRLAIGARGRDVLTQFLVESVVLSILGGTVGVAIGFASAAAVGHFTGWATAVSADAVAIALVFSAAVGIFFGFYPARRAAGLDPIEALRYE